MRASQCALAIALAACGRKGADVRAHGPEVPIVVADHERTAEELETAVAMPIEHALADLPKLAHLHTWIVPGAATVTVELEPGVDPSAVRQAIYERIKQVLRDLPPGTLPMVRSPPGTAVLRYTLHSDSMTAVELRSWQDWVAGPAIARVPGVGDIASCGGALEQRVIAVDPLRLAATGLAVGDVIAAVRDKALPADLGEIALPGKPMRLRDVATIETRGARPDCTALAETGPVVVGTIVAQAGADLRAVRRAAERALADVARPPAIALVVLPRTKPIAFDVDATERQLPAIVDTVRVIPEIEHLVIERDDRTTVRIILGDDADRDAVESRAVAALRARGLSVDDGDLVVGFVGPDLDVLARLVDSARKLVGGSAVGVREDAQTHIAVDDTATRLGIDASQIDQAIRASSDTGLSIATLGLGDRVIPVVIRMPPLEPGRLDAIYVHTHDGTLVPLSSVVRIEARRERTDIRHEDHQRWAGVHVRGEAAAIRHALAHLEMPAGYTWDLNARQ